MFIYKVIMSIIICFFHIGETWQSKVIRVREAIEEKSCDMLVLTALDEVAWLLNLRGNDIPFNPGQL